MKGTVPNPESPSVNGEVRSKEKVRMHAFEDDAEGAERKSFTKSPAAPFASGESMGQLLEGNISSPSPSISPPSSVSSTPHPENGGPPHPDPPRPPQGGGSRRALKAETHTPLTLTRQYQNHFHQSWLEIKHNKCQFCLGCSSIFLVVLIVAVAMSTLSYSSVLFLGMAESQSGEIDLTLQPTSFQGGPTQLNYTKIQEIMAAEGTKMMQHHAPRAQFYVATYDPTTCHGWSSARPMDSNWTYVKNSDENIAEMDPNTKRICDSQAGNCVNYNCQPGSGANLYAINTEKEKEAALGRAWDFPAAPEDGCYIQENLANYLNVEVGDELVVGFKWATVFPTHFQKAKRISHQTPTGYDMVFLVLKIKGTFASSLGKWSGSSPSIVVEMDHILNVVGNHLHPNISASYRNAFASLNPNDAVSWVYFNLPPPRYQHYDSSDFSTNARLVTSWASDLIFLLGFNQVTDSVPILDAMDRNRFAASFLNLILNIVVLLLVAISILLIYSLLMISVESRTFELGVLRMLGLGRSGLIQMLIVHAMMFAIPAWVLGLIFAEILFYFVSILFGRLTDVDISPALSSTSVVVATALGLVIPLLSSILPIKSALTQNLHDSLDTLRSKTKAVMITVERASVHEDLGSVLLIGFFLTAFGFIIYYILPLALLRGDATLLFNIFLAIMIGMLAGLVLLALNAQPLLESFLIWSLFKTILFFENKAIPPILEKNLLAHRLRNRKTAIAYASSLGFIIFLAVALSVELRTLQFQQYSNQGSELRIRAWAFDDKGYPQGIQPMGLLESWAQSNEYVEDFAWVSYHLYDLSPERLRVSVSNFGRYIDDYTRVYSVSPNFFDVVKPGYFEPTIWDESSPYSIGEQMYTPKGARAMIMGHYYKTRLDLDTLDKEIVVSVVTNTKPLSTVKRTVVKPLALAKASPIFELTYFPDTTQDVVVSLTTLLNLTDGQFKSVLDIPMRFMIFKLKDGITNSQINGVIRSIPQLEVGEIQDIRAEFSGLVRQVGTIQMIFQLVTIFTMIVSFFSLNTSMYTNIMEQSKEVGILRALGLGRFAVYRIYTYEAFILVFTSSLLGGIIGTLIGWSISAQRALFTQVPVTFDFPWDLAVTVALVSLFCAILATFLPVFRLVKLQVVNIMRL